MTVFYLYNSLKKGYTESKQERGAGILCNVLLFLGKFAAGILNGSIAMMSDAFNDLSDAASSVTTLLGFRMARQPADRDRPYGHARYEYLSGLAVTALILVISPELAQRITAKLPPRYTAVISFDGK